MRALIVTIKRITMLTLVGIFLTLLMNCASSSTGLKDNALQPYVNEFVRIAIILNRTSIAENVRGVTVKFGDPGEGNYAACYIVTNEIVINKKAFFKLSEENKEELVFHELGHCVIGHYHLLTGIMKTSGFHTKEYYVYNYSTLIHNLFLSNAHKEIKLTFDPNKYPQGKTMSRKAEILENEHAVVRFTADWCQPCQTLKPIFEQAALANPTVKVYVIDVDKDQKTAVDFGVRGIPALLKIVDKEEEERLVGGQTKETVEELFKK